jgi:hypothetical protein
MFPLGEKEVLVEKTDLLSRRRYDLRMQGQILM